MGWGAGPSAGVDEVDMVDHPPHYTHGGVECIDAIRAALGDVGFAYYLRGQVFKYLWRMDYKGNSYEDVRKAMWYLERVVALREKKISRDSQIASTAEVVEKVGAGYVATLEAGIKVFLNALKAAHSIEDKDEMAVVVVEALTKLVNSVEEGCARVNRDIPAEARGIEAFF